MTKTSDKAARRQLQSNISKLRKKGLVQKQGALSDKYARELIKRYSDVLEKRAYVVTVPDKQVRAEYRRLYEGGGRKIVVPKDPFSKRARYSKKAQSIFTYADFYENEDTGEREGYRMEVSRKVRKDAADLPRLKNDQTYVVPMNGAGGSLVVHTFADMDEVKRFLEEYRLKYRSKYSLNYVQIGTRRVSKSR